MSLRKTPNDTLAIEGGTPVRTVPLPYGRQKVEDVDIDSVVSVLRSGFLTCGPTVTQFEETFAKIVGSKRATAVSNGTAALHAAFNALGLKEGDEVLVPSITFAATANAVLYTGATPVFCDVDAGTLLIDPRSAENRITSKTRAIVGVDYAGQPCDYGALQKIAMKHDLWIVDDACHSLDGEYRGKKIGSIADLTVFSFHPVKSITAGEGGMITTDDDDLADRMQRFRNHGISTNFKDREKSNTWHYEMTELGYNYRLTDIQCALGMSQLRHLKTWTDRRREIAKTYDEALKRSELFSPLKRLPETEHGYHLYVIRIALEKSSVDRTGLFRALRAEGIAVNVHYLPVHLHPYYRERLKTKPGLCPVAESEYERILSIPIFPSMTDGDQKDVIEALEKVERAFLRA